MASSDQPLGAQLPQSLQQHHPNLLPLGHSRPGATGGLQRLGPTGAYLGEPSTGRRLLSSPLECLRPARHCSSDGGLLRALAPPQRRADAAATLAQIARSASGPSRSRRSSLPPDLPSRPVAVAGRTAGCALNGPSGPGLIQIRADRQPNCTASSVEGLANDPQGAARP